MPAPKRKGPPQKRGPKVEASTGGNVMLLARNILEQLTARGVLPMEDLRERLMVASDQRMRDAVTELRKGGLILVSDGKDQLVRLAGERRPYGAAAR